MAITEKSTRSFSSLATKFINHFSNSRKKENDVDDLYDIRQGANESLWQYVKRFKETKMVIPDCLDKSVIRAFIKGLLKISKFCENLRLFKPRTFKEVLERAKDAMEYEEKL